MNGSNVLPAIGARIVHCKLSHALETKKGMRILIQVTGPTRLACRVMRLMQMAESGVSRRSSPVYMSSVF